MRRVIALLVAGCSAAAPAKPRTVAAPAAHDNRRHVTGRVLLDGVPVPYFGVTVTASCGRYNILEPATPVRSHGGRFDVTVGPAVADILIAGPGFAARCIEHQLVRHGVATDLGEIAVERGHSIEGRVTDETGRPVAGAEVTIGRVDPRDALTALANGNFATTTDRDGRYQIDGVSAFRTSGRITAVVDGRLVAPPRDLIPDASATIDLTLVSPGTIDGVVHGAPGAQVAFVVWVADPSLVVEVPVAHDAFHVDNLPAGDYEVRVLGAHLPAQRVVVRAGQATTVTFAAP